MYLDARGIEFGRWVAAKNDLPCIQCAGHWRAAEGRSGTLVWRAAKDRLYWTVLVGMCMAGGRRPP